MCRVLCRWFQVTQKNWTYPTPNTLPPAGLGHIVDTASTAHTRWDKPTAIYICTYLCCADIPTPTYWACTQKPEQHKHTHRLIILYVFRWFKFRGLSFCLWFFFFLCIFSLALYFCIKQRPAKTQHLIRLEYFKYFLLWQQNITVLFKYSHPALQEC